MEVSPHEPFFGVFAAIGKYKYGESPRTANVLNFNTYVILQHVIEVCRLSLLEPEQYSGRKITSYATKNAIIIT